MKPFAGVRPNYVKAWFDQRREKYQIYYKQKFEDLDLRYNITEKKFEYGPKVNKSKAADFEEIAGNIMNKEFTNKYMIDSEQNAERAKRA